MDGKGLGVTIREIRKKAQMTEKETAVK